MNQLLKIFMMILVGYHVNIACHGSNTIADDKQMIPKNAKMSIVPNEDDILQFQLKADVYFDLSKGDNFKNFVQNNSIFIDKSLLIKDIIENKSGSSALLISRPRRWGKSLNLNMLKYFFGIEVDAQGNKLEQNPNKCLFNDLKIAQEKTTLTDLINKTSQDVNIVEHFQGTRPVILLSFKDCKGDNFLDIKKGVGRQIYNAYKEHDYLLKSNVLNETDKSDLKENCDNYKKLSKSFVDQDFLKHIDLSDSLKFLTELLYNHHKQNSYLLIDEYDYPVNRLLVKHSKLLTEENTKNNEHIHYIKETMQFISSLISPCSKTSDNYAPEKIILVGINDILVKEGSSGVNNIKTIGINDTALNEYFGINQTEIEEQFLGKMFILKTSKVKTDLMSVIKQWYNGYYAPHTKEKTYNVWSVANYLSDFYNNTKKSFQTSEKIEEGMHRLSLEGRHKPQGYWLKTGDSDVLEHVINYDIEESLLNKLKNISKGEAVPLQFDSDVNLFTYLKNKDGYDSEQGISYLLVNSGYLTQADQKGSYRIPNNEVKEHFDKHVSQAWISKKLNVTRHAASRFSKALSENLGEHEEFGKVIQSDLLTKVSPGDKYEAYFEMLIGGIIENYYLWNKERAEYYTIPQKPVTHGRIDNIFFPNQESTNKCQIIIHEYKKLDKTKRNNIETASEDALWQIYLKNYLEEPLSKTSHGFIPEDETWKVKLRPIIFYQNENDSKWRVHIENYEFNFEEAKKIHTFFEKIPDISKKMMSDTNQVKKMREARDTLLEKNKCESISDLINVVINADRQGESNEHTSNYSVNHNLNNIQIDSMMSDVEDLSKHSSELSHINMKEISQFAPKKAQQNIKKKLKEHHKNGTQITKKELMQVKGVDVEYAKQIMEELKKTQGTTGTTSNKFHKNKKRRHHELPAVSEDENDDLANSQKARHQSKKRK